MNFIQSLNETISNTFNHDGRAAVEEKRNWTIFSIVLTIVVTLLSVFLFFPFIEKNLPENAPVEKEYIYLLPFVILFFFIDVVSLGLIARLRNNKYPEDESDPNTKVLSIMSMFSSLILFVAICFAGYIYYMTYDNVDEKITKETIEKVDLGLSVCWGNKNIGAKKDFEPGDKFAWGETKTKEEFYYDECETTEDSISKLLKEGYIDKNGILTAAHDAATFNTTEGEGWRTPTAAEFKELLEKCKWEDEYVSNTHGYRITGPNGNSIFLPVCAEHKIMHNGEWKYGHYWSSTVYDDDYTASALYFDFKDDSISNRVHRDYGLSIRPVCKK